MSVRPVTAGEYIHDRRRDLGLTKGEVARRLRLSQTEWRDIERGGKEPDDDIIVAVAALLRMSPDELRERYGRWPIRPAPALRAVEAVESLDAVIGDLRLQVELAGANAADALRRAEVAEERARSAEATVLRLMEQLDSDWDGPPDYRSLQ